MKAVIDRATAHHTHSVAEIIPSGTSEDELLD